MKEESEYIDVYQDAVDKWGVSTQVMMTMGECGELIAALNRVFNQGRNEIESVYEEIADVEIMLGQLRCIFGDDKIDKIKSDKINRLAGILDGTVSNPHA